jgi:hypothetical protein
METDKEMLADVAGLVLSVGRRVNTNPYVHNNM